MSQANAHPSDPMAGRPTWLGHPRGLFLLFLVEMWERFSYYGMRGLLVLYLISVISIHQLPAGVYTNELRFTEIVEPQSKGPPQVAARQSRFLHVAVGSASSPVVREPATEGTPRLVVTRLRAVPDPADPKKTAWVPDTSDRGAGVVIHGPAGGTPDRATRGFDVTEVRYRVTNPGGAPIKAEIDLARQGDDRRTFFTVNDEPGVLSAEIKPDRDLKPDEKPYEVVVAPNLHDSGRNWPTSSANVLYGWYTGLAYLFPILGGLIADKLIGTHRSMLVGGVLIALGHTILGVSGFGALAQSPVGMSLFMAGLAVIVLGTGHFKPCVSVMVGQLYRQGDPRRDGAFTIFYMGINLGAFLCAFVCGTLGEKVGWHWGFGSAAVGMLAGLALYLWGRPRHLAGVGEAPRAGAGKASALFFVASVVLAAGFALAFHEGLFAMLGSGLDRLQQNQAASWAVVAVLLGGILAWTAWFIAANRPEDRGPVASIFIFMFFNAFFWIAFEQAGSSLNIFTKQNTDRMLGSYEVPATWFQSVNAGLIFLLAPFFAAMWTALGKRRLNPSQPVKIALGLIFLGLGYLFMVVAGRITVGGAAKASMVYILATYFWHTVGELCLSPTGLSYVTKAAPARFVSLLMGIWFVSSFIANLGGGLIASQVEAVERGLFKLPWSFGGKADFFFLFVVFSIGPGVLILLFTPLLKKLIQGREESSAASG